MAQVDLCYFFLKCVKWKLLIGISVCSKERGGGLDHFFDKQPTSIYWKKMVYNRGQFQV